MENVHILQLFFSKKLGGQGFNIGLHNRSVDGQIDSKFWLFMKKISIFQAMYLVFYFLVFYIGPERKFINHLSYVHHFGKYYFRISYQSKTRLLWKWIRVWNFLHIFARPHPSTSCSPRHTRNADTYLAHTRTLEQTCKRFDYYNDFR